MADAVKLLFIKGMKYSYCVLNPLGHCGRAGSIPALAPIISNTYGTTRFFKLKALCQICVTLHQRMCRHSLHIEPEGLVKGTHISRPLQEFSSHLTP